MTMALRAAGLAFACLALVAGGLQIWAYVETDGPRHLILGVFACAVGVSVVSAVTAAWRRDRHRADQRAE